MLTALRDSVERSWYSGRPNILLLPFSWLYGAITWARALAYKYGLLPQQPGTVPVIVVGNLSVGGTGKSPVVAWLAAALGQDGYKVGIVSRGYGGQSQAKPLLVTAATAVAVAGDEPVMLAAQTGVPVCVSPDRAAAVACLAAEGVNLVISDDGLQHYRMSRCVEIIVVDGARGFGNGALLPAGPLREPVSRSQSVDHILVNGSQTTVAGLHFQLEPAAAIELTSGATMSLDKLSGQRVWGLAGIGNPDRFYDLLESFDAQVDRVAIADHGSCSLEQLLAERQQPIIMTSKDAVKYGHSAPANAWSVPVAVQFEPAERDGLLGAIKTKLQAWNPE
jgi:tetraacyldisaccharide 4'-kinase